MFVTGLFYGEGSLGGDTLGAQTEERTLELTRLAATGEEIATSTVARANQAYPLGALALDSSGRAFEAGAFMNTLDQVGASAQGDMDAYVLVHDPAGVVIGYAQVGTPLPDYALSLEVGGDGQAVLAVVTHKASFTDDLTLVRYAV